MRDWTLEIAVDPAALEEADVDARIFRTPDRKHALIILPSRRSSADNIANLVHELLHCVFCWVDYRDSDDPLREMMIEQTIESLATALLNP